MSCSSSSMTSEVLGSKPEFGSSQNKYLGFSAIALAMATRFCIPPLISAGYLLSESMIFTLFRHSCARLRRSRSVILENISNGNITFSITESESNRAADWNNMPISRLICAFSCLLVFTKSRPS